MDERTTILTPCIATYDEVLAKIPREQLHSFVLDTLRDSRVTMVLVTPIGVSGHNKSFDSIGLWCKENDSESKRLPVRTFRITEKSRGRIELVPREETL